MKKLIALTALLSMSVAFAADDVVYGTFVLNSSEPELILCVPWINPGSTDGSKNDSILVTDLIQTSTLEVGDLLFYYEGGSYKAWQVDANKAWEKATTVSDTTVSDKVIQPTGTETLTRGNAVILKRDMTIENRSKDIIINGQVGGTFNGINLTRGDGAVYSLIAPPNPDGDTSINSVEWEWSDVCDQDVITVDGLAYNYDSTKKKWGTKSYDFVENSFKWVWTYAEDVKIRAGRGAWFRACGEKDRKTTWKPLQQSAN